MQKPAFVCKIHQKVVKHAECVLRHWFGPEAGAPNTPFQKRCPRHRLHARACVWDTVYVTKSVKIHYFGSNVQFCKEWEIPVTLKQKVVKCGTKCPAEWRNRKNMEHACKISKKKEP